MRQRIAAKQIRCDTAASTDGWIPIVDVDMQPFLARAYNTLTSPSNVVGGVGSTPDAVIQAGFVISPFSGDAPSIALANYPVYAVVRAAWGGGIAFLSNGFFGGLDTTPPTGPATFGDIYESQEVIVRGNQAIAQADQPLVSAKAGMFWSNFYPRGRMIRFAFQMEVGGAALSSFNLNTELWLVNSDGR